MSVQDKKTITVFVIEDDDMDFKGLIRAFEKAKISNPIIRAGNGEEALEMLRSREVQRPYVILLDLNMPRMNGFEFLKVIRADENFKRSIVFVMTTSNREEDQTEAYNQLIAGYIIKSDLGDGFIKAIQMLDYYWEAVELPKS